MKQAEFIWIVAHIQPATISEVQDAAPGDPHREAVADVAVKCFRHGFVQRRRRPVDGMGPDPYKYALAPLPDSDR